MKTLNGYEVVDEYARQLIAELQSSGGGGTGGSCNIPLISDSTVDISTVSPGIYAINSAQYTLSCVQCSEINATVNFNKWVSNGMLLIRDRNVVAWGQDNADIMFYVINMDTYIDQTVSIDATGCMDTTGWVSGITGGEVDLSNYYTKDECDQQFNTAAIYEAIPSDDHINELIDAKLGVIENGSY